MRSEVRISSGTRDFSLPQNARNGFGGPSSPCWVVIRGSFQDVTRQWLQADYSHSSSVVVKNEWSYTSTPLTPNGLYRENFNILCAYSLYLIAIIISGRKERILPTTDVAHIFKVGKFFSLTARRICNVSVKPLASLVINSIVMNSVHMCSNTPWNEELYTVSLTAYTERNFNTWSRTRLSRHKFRRHPACRVSFSVVLVRSSLITVIFYTSVITTLAYNDTRL